MSENIFQKVVGLAAKAFGKEAPDPYQTPVDDVAAAPQSFVIRPQAIGSAEIYGDVPHVPPEFNR